MYSLGIPVGYFVDKSPRPVVMLGAFLLGIGYFPFGAYYESGSGSVAMMCFFSFLTGFGGCMAFAAAIKTSALNWPHHRGTATAFPLAAFGLSAFFFSAIGSTFFNGNTSSFLMLLATGTSGMIFLGFFFLRVLPPTSSYHAVPTLSGSHDSQQLRRTLSEEAKIQRRGHATDVEPGMSPYNTAGSGGEGIPTAAEDLAAGASAANRDRDDVEAAPTAAEEDSTETSSLMSKNSSLSGEVLMQNNHIDLDRSHRVDIQGWRLLTTLEFYQFFSIMAILAGIGLMTIKYGFQV
jgi:hypothetical protein